MDLLPQNTPFSLYLYFWPCACSISHASAKSFYLEALHSSQDPRSNKRNLSPTCIIFAGGFVGCQVPAAAPAEIPGSGFAEVTYLNFFLILSKKNHAACRELLSCCQFCHPGAHLLLPALQLCLPLTPWARQRPPSAEGQSTPKRDLALPGSQHLLTP